MKSTNILLLFYTVYYLKFKQIFFRLYYFMRAKWRKIQSFRYLLKLPSSVNNIVIENSIPSIVSYRKNEFIFLNLGYSFDNEIDWNFFGYGKLWTYNLTYFDYLHQKDMTQEVGLMLINDFVDQSASIADGLMPFPISLRGINWIKFFSKHKIEDQKINDSLYAQYFILMDNVEYHILGNHLLENGFSLLFGAYYFQDEKLYAKAKKILTDELEEQILQDGAHFELSPMYHQLMLFRILDCINLVENNNWKNQELLKLLISKAEIMLGWLNVMTFKNGNIPLFNDSANKIAPTTKELNNYAMSLNSKFKIDQRKSSGRQNSKLSDSGYRKINHDSYEMIIDVGNIGPDYILGHAHSDTFNFELYVHNQPVIVDTGLSTYETNKRRQLERSTKSHNTVVVDGDDQSQVWGGFRVAKRAKIIDLKELTDSIEATQDSYKDKGVWHIRKFITKENQIIIRDNIKSKKEHSCVAYLHFHPDIQLHIESEKLISKLFTITFINSYCIELTDYKYSPEFNTKINAKCAIISFQNELKTNIRIKDINENN